MKKLNLLLVMLVVPVLTYAQVNLTQGLVAHYAFNNPAFLGADSTNYNRHLPSSGNMALSPDRKGINQSALTFTEGILKDYNLTPGLPVNAADRSFSLWFKKAFPTQLESITQFFFFYGSMGTGEGNGMAMDYTGSLYFIGYQDDLIKPFSLNFNQWYHVAGTYDGATASLYLDGVLIDQQNKSWNTDGTSLRIGALDAGIQGGGSQVQYDNYFAGALDEFRIYNRVITNDEILVLADKLINGIEDVSNVEVATLYPNPTSEMLHLQLTETFKKDVIQVQFLDVTGKVIKTLRQQEWQTPVSLLELPAGVYVCRIASKDTVRNLKFVKQ